MKKCSRCGELKPLSNYYRASGNSLRGDCIPCNLAAKAERHRLNPEPARRRTKEWQMANPELVAANREAFIASGGKKIADRRSHLKRKYGMSLEEYDAMLDAQGGGCFICRRPPREDLSLHVDHDHSTGKVRGILCFCCNNALADFQEDPALLAKAAAYLSWHANQEEIQLARRRAFSLVGAGPARD